MKTSSKYLKNIFLAGTCMVLICSCTKEEQAPLALEAELLLQYSSLELQVDSGMLAGQFELALNFDGNALGQLLSDNGYTMDQLQEFRFNLADLSILSPTDANYNAIERIGLSLAIDGSDPVVIAQKDPIPDGVNNLQLEINDINLANIVRNNNVQLRANGVLSGPINITTLQKLDLGGKVVVKL